MSQETNEMIEIRALARQLDPEPEHAFQVCRYALRLFDALTDLHGYGPRERDILEAAALLHDTGHVRDMWRHHKHALDIIMELALPGFMPEEHRMVACVARYHRKAFPKPTHKVYADLTPASRKIVGRLAAILRIADGLDRGHMATAKGIEVRISKNKVNLMVAQRRASEVDLWGARRKAGLFEVCFGKRMVIDASSATEKEQLEQNM